VFRQIAAQETEFSLLLFFDPSLFDPANPKYFADTNDGCTASR
jgi:hypothetical protein